MISLPSNVLDLMDQGRTRIRGVILFEFGTGTYGFIKSNAPFIYGGVTYHPGGLISVSNLSSGVGMAANNFTVSLAASPDDGLTPEVLQLIEAEDYRDRPVTIADLHFHPDTDEFLHYEILRRGYCDVIDHDDTVRTGYMLIMSCETRALDYSRTNARFRSPADQQRRNAGDKFFDNSAMRGREEIFWGRERKVENTGNTSSKLPWLKSNY